MLEKLIRHLRRNEFTLSSAPARGVCVEWWSAEENLGDFLAPVICEWMLARRPRAGEPARTCHLLSVGSVIGLRPFDAVVWGSGIHCEASVRAVRRNRLRVRYDIRAVRGPVTARVLRQAGYRCPDVWGDPAVLMPLLYPARTAVRRGCSVISHRRTAHLPVPPQMRSIDIRTRDYRAVVNAITASERVISSSLHGIILAESYGVPAVFWAPPEMDAERMKFDDWYASTGRRTVCAQTLEEAAAAIPPALPDLGAMRRRLLDSFPYDLWGEGEEADGVAAREGT